MGYWYILSRIFACPSPLKQFDKDYPISRIKERGLEKMGCPPILQKHLYALNMRRVYGGTRHIRDFDGSPRTVGRKKETVRLMNVFTSLGTRDQSATFRAPVPSMEDEIRDSRSTKTKNRHNQIRFGDFRAHATQVAHRPSLGRLQNEFPISLVGPVYTRHSFLQKRFYLPH